MVGIREIANRDIGIGYIKDNSKGDIEDIDRGDIQDKGDIKDTSIGDIKDMTRERSYKAQCRHCNSRYL